MKAKIFLTAALLLGTVLPVAAQSAKPESHGPLCLRVRDIKEANSRDGKIMTFQMKDGTVYANHLQQSCDSLRFGGFVWTVNQTEEVCEGVQTLRALTTGEICRLGKFDPPTKTANR
jgi:hypothetical protein